MVSPAPSKLPRPASGCTPAGQYTAIKVAPSKKSITGTINIKLGLQSTQRPQPFLAPRTKHGCTYEGLLCSVETANAASCASFHIFNCKKIKRRNTTTGCNNLTSSLDPALECKQAILITQDNSALLETKEASEMLRCRARLPLIDTTE